MKVVRILGVDPGSRLTGYGVVDLVGNQLRHVTHGTLRLANTGGKAVIPLERRLRLVFEQIGDVIEEFKPSVLAIENIYFAKDATAALKLGQARGIVLLLAELHGLELVEYNASVVKATVAGHGNADKHAVQKMVQTLTGQKEFATVDASDALAIALCHAMRMGTSEGGSAASKYAEALKAAGVSSVKKKKRMSLAESVGLSARTLEKGLKR